MRWIDAIIKVMQAENTPMHYIDITNKIIELGYRKPKELGATPEATVGAQLSTQPQIFEKIDKGIYKLHPSAISKTCQITETKAEITSQEIEKQRTCLIKNFGMYWNRFNVDWKSMNMLGIQTEKAQPVNLKNQIGIYMLHDAREVIYVGQAIKQPISKRLADHCKDRLSGRWDRFSWFGFYHIDETGKLIDNYSQNNFSIENLANTLEALLVEGLEPRQNRKSGNEFGMEFLQYEDEKLRNAKAMNLILEKFK